MLPKIIAVDDEPGILKAFKTIVESLGYEVVTIVDSREAAERLKAEKFNGIFVDAQMPNLDGFQLTELIRSSPLNGKTPIVMITGHDDGETMRRAFKAGVTFFLGKPFTRERVRGLFNAALGLLLNDRRRYPRLPFQTTAKLRYRDKHLRANSLNISEGGMLLEASGGASAGQELELEFVLPQAPEPLKARAKVLRKEPPDRIGVQFTSLTGADRKAIQDYISGGAKR